MRGDGCLAKVSLGDGCASPGQNLGLLRRLDRSHAGRTTATPAQIDAVADTAIGTSLLAERRPASVNMQLSEKTGRYWLVRPFPFRKLCLVHQAHDRRSACQHVGEWSCEPLLS